MNAQTFAKKLFSAAPTEQELVALGLDSASAKDFLKAYTCIKRKEPIHFPDVLGCENLVELFRGWDLSDVTIGMVQFSERPATLPRGLQIGMDEADPLLILHSNGEIVVEEAGTSAHLLGEVAENGDKLIEALIGAAQFLGQRVSGRIAFDDFAAAKSVAARCASAAGGNKYLDFYLYLLGAEE